MCLGEFNLSFSEYENMTWAEFMIRLFSFNRVKKEKWYHTRFIAYQVYVSNWQNPKRKPLSIDRFFDLDSKVEKTGLSNKSNRDAILKAQKEYNNRK